MTPILNILILKRKIEIEKIEDEQKNVDIDNPKEPEIEEPVK